jgi:hypothetical protein
MAHRARIDSERRTQRSDPVIAVEFGADPPDQFGVTLDV